jgi:hypothetical protein
MYIFFFSLLLGLITSCHNKNENITVSADTVISTGAIHEWFGEGDSFTIKADKIFYHHFVLNENLEFTKQTLTFKRDWEELMGLLDKGNFQDIISTNGNGLEGSDTWIYVKSGTNTYEIRFNSKDSTMIKGIRPFVDKLDAIKTKYLED